MFVIYKLNLDKVNISAGLVVNRDGLYNVIDERTGRYFSRLISSGPTWCLYMRYVFRNIKEAEKADEILNGELRKERMRDDFFGDLPPIKYFFDKKE